MERTRRSSRASSRSRRRSTTREGDERTGVGSLKKALEEPMRLIAENAGEEGSVVVDAVLRSKQVDYGFDAAIGEDGNMKKKGIIDPVKVVRTAIENAASIVGMVLTTEPLVTEIPEPPQAMP